LIPNGSNIAVTKENRIQYIYLVANYKLNSQIKKQSEVGITVWLLAGVTQNLPRQALFEGVAEMIDPKWLR
jgi:ubiquitin-protein ligase E3 C